MDLYGEVQRLANALSTAQVDYALCGGIALAVHGLPRATKDIDVLARREDVPRLKQAAASCGFTLEALPMTFSSSGITIQRLTKVDAATGAALMLDVLFADEPLRAVWEGRTEVATDGGALWVVSREGLITLKLAAGRPQDLVDVQRLKEVAREDDA
jgi:hypothetical protein